MAKQLDQRQSVKMLEGAAKGLVIAPSKAQSAVHIGAYNTPRRNCATATNIFIMHVILKHYIEFTTSCQSIALSARASAL